MTKNNTVLKITTDSADYPDINYELSYEPSAKSEQSVVPDILSARENPLL